MGQRLVVSEFPNDNPELHDGLVWACPAPCAPALPTLRLRPTAAARVLKPGWERQTPLPPAVAADAGSEVEPAPAPEFEVAAMEPAVEPAALTEPAKAETVVGEPVDSALPTEALVEGALPTEALVEEDLPGEASPEEPLSGFDAFLAALSGILAERGATRAASSVPALLGKTRLAPEAFDAPTTKTLVARGILDAKSQRPTPEFSVVAHAWRDVLDGTGGDLAACGSATLDVFGAELLVTLLGVPSGRADDLRRALRQRGVAAFGMLAAA